MKSPPPLPSNSQQQQQQQEVHPATAVPQNQKLTTFLLALIGSLSVLTVLTLILIVVFVARNASKTAMSSSADAPTHAAGSNDTKHTNEPDTGTTSREDHAPNASGTGAPVVPPPSPTASSTNPTPPTSDQPPPTPPTSDQPPPTPPTSDQPPPTPPTADQPPPTSDSATKSGKPSAPTNYTIPNLESEQLLSDWITDPLSIFCTVQLKSTWIPEEEEFYTKSGPDIARERMARSLRTFPDAWSGIRTCRLDLAAFDAPNAKGALPIATSTLDEMDAAITVDHDSRKLFLKLRWRKDPTKVTTELIPMLVSQWRDYEKNTKTNRKLISSLVVLNSTSYGKALRTKILKDFTTSTDDLGTQGSEKANRLDTLRLSLDTFEERTLREAQTRISECDYKIWLASTMQRIYYPPVGFIDGYWESLESWRNRIAVAQQPFIATRTECLRVKSKTPNEVLKLDSLLDEHSSAIRELHTSSEQIARRSPLRLTLPHTIEWSTNDGTTAVLPLVIDCHFK